MKNMGKHTIANIFTKLWSMISIYIFIPLYIKYMGETSYGLVSFFATLQMTMNLMGLGLSNTLRREFAVGDKSEENSIKKYKLLRTVELIFWLIGSIIIIICCMGSSFIANKWLNIETLSPEIVSSTVMLMGISIALQLISNLYAGCLFGLNYQVLANIICITWSVAKSLGSLTCLVLITPDIRLFYIWHICTDIIYMIVLRIFVIRKLKLSRKVCWKISDFSNIHRIWRYASGILLISLIALFNKQLDKVIISRFLTLSELGAYNVATTLGNLITIIPSALYITIFPKFTNLATTNQDTELLKQFKKTNKVVNIFISCMTAYIAVYSSVLIRIWTGSESYVETLGFTSFFVVLAVGIIEFQEIPYALALANGNTKFNVFTGMLFIPILVICTYYGIGNYGLLGAGIVYFLMMMGQTLLYQLLIYKKYIKKKVVTLLLIDTVCPLLISLIVAYISKYLASILIHNILIEFLFAIICGGITLVNLLFVFANKEIRYTIKSIIK